MMRRESPWRGTALTVLAVWTLAGLGAAAAPADDLDTAKGLYREGRFSEAIVTLRAALGELTLLRNLELRRVQLADAYLHLGLAHLALLERDQAREAFREMLRVDPTRRMDPETYAPKVIALVEEARAELSPAAPAPPAAGRVPAGAGREPRRRSRLPLVLAVGGGIAAGATALALRDSGPPEVSLRCEPGSLGLVQSPVTSTCTVTAGEGKDAVRVSLECSGQPSGVPCRLDPDSLSVAAGGALTSNLVLDMAYTARPNSYAFQVKASSAGSVRTANLQLNVAEVCAGFMERPSNTQGECSNRPANTICWGFPDGYLWVVDGGFGAPAYNLGPCDGRTVQVARGSSGDYHHIIGTLFVKATAPTR